MTKILIHEDDWPRCDKCEMPVQEFYVTDTGDALEFVAKCHDKVQIVKVSNELWDNVSSMLNVNIGPAFREEQL